MRTLAVTTIAALAGAACTPDSVPFEISLELDEECGANSCRLIVTRCNAAIGLRIVDASSGKLYVSECISPVEGGATLCDLVDGLDLDPRLLPNTMVRIEMAIWPYDEALADPCPEIVFTVSGEYQSGDPQPALAGLGYFKIGSNDVAPLTLRCVEPELLDAVECRGDSRPHIRAKVIDFLDNFEVGDELETHLAVEIAEPTYNSVTEEWFISQVDLVELMSTVMGGTLTYDVDYPFTFEKTACLQVLQDDLGAAATVRCYPAAPEDIEGSLLELDGTLLDNDTLFLIRQAIGGDPSALVIGKVLDDEGNAAAGAVVTSSFGTLQYLSDDLTSVTGLSETSTSGVFVSTDAPLENDFRETNFWTATRDGTTSLDTVVGGIINNKVTVIILKLPPPGPKP